MISARLPTSDSHGLLKARSPLRLENYDEKLQSAMELNAKLKELLQTMRNNAVARKAEQVQSGDRGGEQQQVARLRRRQGKLTSELQQLTNNLNVLVSENGKLKAQVDVSRNSRVIYSNVYKTIEKEIRKHELLYKLAIIDYLAYEEVQKRTADRLQKTARRIEKDIGELEGGAAKPRRKDKEKRKSRLDTGLSHRMESMDTCRPSNDEGTARQNPSLRETALSRREPEMVSKREQLHRASVDKPDPAPLAAQRREEERHQRTVRSNGQILHETGDDYFELEMKSNYYDNLIKHLRQITAQEDLGQIANEWQQADTQVEQEYQQYLLLEQQAKALREEREALDRQLQLQSQKDIAGACSVEEEELVRVRREVEEERKRVVELEWELTAVMDINSTRLSDEEIEQHVQRVRRRGEASARELERLLEGVSKERSVGASRVINKSRVG